MSCDPLKITLEWILLIVGVPTLTYIFLYTAIQHTFQTATIGWQMLMGLVLILALVCYVYFGIVKLIKKTQECFE